MGRWKLDKPRKLALLTTVILLLACLGLMVGAAWARYRYRETTDMIFAPKESPQVHLYADTAYTPLPQTFTEEAEGKLLQFVVSNAESAEKFSADDQYATVRLYGSLGLGAGENLTAVLSVDGTEYTATARPVDKDSPVHTSFGEGWIYCFLDDSGNELRWLLEGKTISTKQMQLKITTREGVDTSMLQLLVTSQTY